LELLRVVLAVGELKTRDWKTRLVAESRSSQTAGILPYINLRGITAADSDSKTPKKGKSKAVELNSLLLLL